MTGRELIAQCAENDRIELASGTGKVHWVWLDESALSICRRRCWTRRGWAKGRNGSTSRIRKSSSLGVVVGSAISSLVAGTHGSWGKVGYSSAQWPSSRH